MYFVPVRCLTESPMQYWPIIEMGNNLHLNSLVWNSPHLLKAYYKSRCMNMEGDVRYTEVANQTVPQPMEHDSVFGNAEGSE